jgi:DNA repair protein RecN (Recombination protein N)
MIEVTGDNAPLIEMTGQHDNRNLLSKSYHLDLLDQYAAQHDKRSFFESKYNELIQLRSQISHFQTQLTQKNQRLDFLKYQLEEFEKIHLNPLADENLENEIKAMKNSHKIIKFADECEQILFNDDDSVIYRLKTVQKRAFEISQFGGDFTEKLKGLDQAANLIEDTFFSIRKEINLLQLDADILEQKEDRLSKIRKLQKKYGQDLNEIVRASEEIRRERSELENSDDHINKLRKQATLLELELKSLAEELHKMRVKFAEKLSASVNKELADLNMKGVTFSIQVMKLESLNSTGISETEFLCHSSPKDPARPIAKVASGGELSRILLSLKKSLGQSDKPRTYLFDEVDTGVSGNTAEKVGRKLKSIAKGQQVICVTHLPQVAAFGDVHFSISKTTMKNGVSMTVSELKSRDRIEEIARLISGEKITNTSIAHAEQLLSESLG